MASIRSTLICIIVSLFVASSIASLYTFSNVNGGSWQTGSNWTPEGVPGADDDVVFPYIDGVADSITLTIDGDVTVNSMTVEHFSFHFRSGSITIQNDCLFNAGTYKQMNITLLGNSTWLSTGSGNYVTCDGCVVNIKKSLALLSNGSGYTKILTTAATFVNYAGATFTLGFGAMDPTNGQYGTLINYGTLLFQTYTGTYPPTPYGFPIRAETGPWLEFRNYGDMRVDHIDTEVGSVVNSLVKYFNFLDGKLTLRIVQNSTANNGQGFDSNYEYNDVMASGGSYDYYEANINGDVHVIFAQATVADGQDARPFNPQPGDFFPVFGGFMKYTGKIRTLTVEGLSSGLTIGRKTIPDVNSSDRSLNGIVICSTSDTACINASGEVQTPTDASTPVAPGTNAPTRGTTPTTSITSSASSLELVAVTVTLALTSLLF